MSKKMVKVCGECDTPLVWMECSIGGMWECHNYFCYYYFYNTHSSPPVVERESDGEDNAYYNSWD